MTLVVDASVILKWLLRDPARESDTARATELMQAVACGDVAVLQPVHWPVEVGAILARLSPVTADTAYVRSARRLGHIVSLPEWRR